VRGASGSDASSIPEVAGKAALLVHPDDAGAHVEAIKSLLDSVGQREAMFEAGRQRAREFTWAAAAARLRLALGELV
jgi:glycosyltransferase involved in cell wall biosynthesis